MIGHVSDEKNTRNYHDQISVSVNNVIEWHPLVNLRFPFLSVALDDEHTRTLAAAVSTCDAHTASAAVTTMCTKR